MNAKIIFSKTGEVHGYGSEPYKWVSRLTKAERDAVKNGETVIVEADRKSGGGNGTGTYYRQVTYNPGYGYGHRVPLVPDDAIEKIRYA